MPELPDVEVFRRYLDRTGLHHRVEHATLETDQVLREVSVRTLRRRLESHRLERTHRHGKYLFVGLDDDDGDGALVLHFGMTGFLRYFHEEGSAPAHPRLRLDLDNGYHLVYDSQRMLGEVGVTDDVGGFIEEHHLGPDALSLSPDDFVELLSDRRGGIKTTLMDQHTLAGIGNVYSDEILFQARLDPATPVRDLDGQALRKLHGTMRHVLETAIGRRADPDRVPSSWLLAVRDRSVRCPRCGGDLERRKVGQRTAWLCPRCQRRP